MISTVHLGPAAYQMEKRGVQTFAGDLNREIRRANGILAAIKKTINGLRDWLSSLSEKKRQLESKQEQLGFIPVLLTKYIDLRKAERADWEYGQQNALIKDLQ